MAGRAPSKYAQLYTSVREFFLTYHFLIEYAITQINNHNKEIIMQYYKLIIPTLCFFLAGTLHASDFSYTSVSLSYGEFESDDVEGDGYSLSGNYEFESGIVVGAAYTDQEFDEILGFSLSSLGVDVEVETIGISVGQAFDLGSNGRGLVSGFYIDGETDSNVPLLDGLDVQSYGVGFEGRWWLMPNLLEGRAGIAVANEEVEDEDDSGFIAGLGLRVHVAEPLILGISASRNFVGDEDVDVIAAEIRLEFD